MKKGFRGLVFLAVLVSAPLAAQVASCQLQGEGERCSHKNGNQDCDTGLVCVSGKDLGSNADICCRGDGMSTAPECTKGGATSSTGSASSSSSAGGSSSSSSASGTGGAASSSSSSSTSAS